MSGVGGGNGLRKETMMEVEEGMVAIELTSSTYTPAQRRQEKNKVFTFFKLLKPVQN